VHWKITALWGGKKVELRETQRALTPFGVWWCSSNFCGGSAIAKRCGTICPFSLLSLRSPNAIDPVKTLTGLFALGGRRSAALRPHQFAARRHRLARAVGNLPVSHRRHGSQPVQTLRAGPVSAFFLVFVELAVQRK